LKKGHRGPDFADDGFRCVHHGGVVQTHRCATPCAVWSR
jgi:hypothetical protein